MTLLFIIAS